MRLAGVPQWDAPEHSRCCSDPWRSAGFVDAFAARVRRASVADRRIAYVYDAAAVDEGNVPYTKALALRERLMREYPVIDDRVYAGFKERIGLTVLRVSRSR